MERWQPAFEVTGQEAADQGVSPCTVAPEPALWTSMFIFLCTLGTPLPSVSTLQPEWIFLMFIFIFLFGRSGSQLWHAGSVVAACELLVAACGI